MTASVPGGPARTLFGYNFFGPKHADTAEAGAPDGSKPDARVSISPHLRTTQDTKSDTNAMATISAVKKPTSSSDLPQKPSSMSKTHSANTGMLDRDTEALQKLLDRDGGSAGFEFEDGAPAGGQKKAVKREMFRLM